MKKEDQILMNWTAKEVWTKAMAELESTHGAYKVERLRSCSASVLETENYYILRSYKTFVAVIDKYNNACVDMLRHEYVYTATSSQHICKFQKDYGRLTCRRFTWREVA